MTDRNPEQLTLFPELFIEEQHRSITSLPEYDKAIENFIRIADMGAFIDLQISGLDKSYSVSTEELSIPEKYLVGGGHQSSGQYNLIPSALRQGLNRIRYEVRSFFNRQNSFKTPFGYFLYRPYFILWDRHRRQCLKQFTDYINASWSEQEYLKQFMKIFTKGYNFLYTAMVPDIPYSYLAEIAPELVFQLRAELTEEGITISKLNPEDSNFILKALALKTLRIPENLEKYVSNIRIVSVFKSIDLQYLKGITIRTVEDIQHLSEKLWKDNPVD